MNDLLTARPRTTDLGQETLVQGSKALLLEDGRNTRPSPVVLGDLASNLGGVLNSALDNVHGGVEDGTDSATDGTGDEVVGHLAALGVGFGEHLANLENATKVTGVPEDVAPHGALQTLVHGQDTLVLDSLDDAVDHAVVLAGGGLVLEANLDELEGDDDKGLGGTGRGTGEDGEGLVHLADTKHLAVDLAPFVVGGELGRTLGSLHENRGRDTAVETGESGKNQFVSHAWSTCRDRVRWKLPFILDNLAEAVDHAVVRLGTGSIGLQLPVRLVSIEGFARPGYRQEKGRRTLGS